MRIFEKPNLNNDWKCPVCGTNQEKEVVLVTIEGTKDDGVMCANQYHLECLELTEAQVGFKTVVGMVFNRIGNSDG